MENKLVLEDGFSVELKKDYLTIGEVRYLVTESIIGLHGDSSYRNGEEDIEGSDYNYISMHELFYNLLILMCVELDEDDEEKLQECFNHGVHLELLKAIKNAKYAYNLLLDYAKHESSVERIVEKYMKQFKEILDSKIPSQEVLEQSLEKAPKEFEKVAEKYKEIIKGK